MAPINVTTSQQQITANVAEDKVTATVTGGFGATGPQGPSGVVTVTAPITNAGTTTAANIGLSIGTGLSVSSGSLVVTPGTYAASSHNHDASAINAGTLAAARLPVATANAIGGVRIGSGISIDGNGVISASVGTGSTQVAAGDHGHGNIGSDGAIVGFDPGLVLTTGEGGVISPIPQGSAGDVLQVNATGDGAQWVYLSYNDLNDRPSFGSMAFEDAANYVAATDSRMSDARTPLSHASSHATGGADALTAADIGAAAVSHAHSAADVTSGTFDIALIPTGTTSTTVSLGNHTHTQLHDRSHAITSTSDHTAGNWKVFHSNGSGEVVEVTLGSSGQALVSNGATAAPTFQGVQKTITSGTAAPTGGSDGDIYLQYS